MGLIFGLVVVGIAVLLFVKSRKPRATNKKPPTARKPIDVTATSKFHAVSINCSNNACDAAKALVDVRLLSSEAPPLPLSECDASDCQCRFVHYKDRRSNRDRRDGYSQALGGDTGKFRKEQRRRDRRNNDPDDYFG